MLPSRPLKDAQQSATKLVRSFLQQHDRLSTQELFKLGIGDARPALPADHAITPEGKLRMKRVSNMREGSRLWVPPPTAPYPGHPFRSVHYFKKSILHHLEASGLIRLIEYQRPITDQAGRDEAIRKARVYTIRRETTAKKTARKAGLPYRPDTVEAVEPVFFSKHYAWVLGDSSEPDLRSTPIPAPKNADLAWSAAEELERRRLLAEEEEAERIAERKERRKLKYKQEGEAYKAERQRLIDAGLWEQFLATKAKEAQREEAIDTVRQYAEQTGEDVSAWFQELGVRVRPSFFGGDRMQSSEEQEDLAAEMYKQEQAALVEAERERERNGGKTVARPAQAHDQDHDDPSSFGLKSPRKPDYPVDWAWQEQLKAKLAPGSDSPFILKSASTPPSASRLRATPEPAEPVNRMSDEQRARGQEQLQWSRTAPVSRSGRGKGFGLR